MKTIIYIILFVLFSSLTFGQRHQDYDFPYETGVKTLKFEVLDINFEKKLLAFKHIYELQTELFYGEDGEETNNPVDCEYAGMEKYPKAGVVLGIFDLEKGEYLKTFTVYESCYELSNCYKHEFSVKQLESAKQMFLDKDLDISKDPEPMLFTKTSKDEYTLSIEGIQFRSSYVNDYDNLKTVSNLYSNGKLLYYIEYGDNFAMASHGQVFYRAAYKEGNKIVFLNKFYHDNNMEGVRSYEFHDFSPIFIIKGNQVVLE